MLPKTRDCGPRCEDASVESQGQPIFPALQDLELGVAKPKVWKLDRTPPQFDVQLDLLKTPEFAVAAVQPQFEQFVTLLKRFSIDVETRQLEAALSQVITKQLLPRPAEWEPDTDNVVAFVPKSRMGMLDRDFCNLVRADRFLWPEAEKMRLLGKVLVGDVVSLRRQWYAANGFSAVTQRAVADVLRRVGLVQGAVTQGWRPNPQRLAPLNKFVVG